ncbi:HD domain-containing protein [Streptomyces sp. NPDC025273]|uniref:HD domain-containing protein n=1 Tax=Streptomyces sp. NPDC025273 TaxID=3155251 RepID=UPI0033F005CF
MHDIGKATPAFACQADQLAVRMRVSRCGPRHSSGRTGSSRRTVVRRQLRAGRLTSARAESTHGRS